MSTPSTSTVDVRFVKRRTSGYRPSRRELLAKGLGLGSSFLVGSGYLDRGLMMSTGFDAMRRIHIFPYFLSGESS